MDIVLFQDFKDYLVSNNKRGDWDVKIKRYLNWCDSVSLNPTVATFTDFQRYLVDVMKTNSNASRNKHRTALKIFYDWLVLAGRCNQSVADEFGKVKRAKQIVNPHRNHLTKEQLADVIEMCSSFIDWHLPEKIQAILWFMFYTGVRKDELLSLTRDKFDLKKRQVTILGKGNKVRVVSFPKKIAKVGTTEKQDFLELLTNFFGVEPEDTNAFNISKFQIDRIFKEVAEYAKREGIPHITPHSMRHSYGRYLAKKGIGMREAQKWLGHATIGQTEIYFDVDLETMMENYDEKID